MIDNIKGSISNIAIEKFKSEVSCTLTPFSFFRSRHYFAFRVIDTKIYRVYLDRDLLMTSRSDIDPVIYIEFLKRLKEDLYSESQSNVVIADILERVTNLEEYLYSDDQALVQLGTDILKGFIQNVKVELGYADEE